MPRKTLGEKIDDLRDRVITLEVEFSIVKKVGYAILIGVIGILIKLFWKYIAASPSIVTGTVISLFNSSIIP